MHRFFQAFATAMIASSLVVATPQSGGPPSNSAGIGAQSASFTNLTLGSILANSGVILPLHWTAGNGYSLSLAVGNETWNTPIASNLAANPGNYNWTVALPPRTVSGNYTLSLSQLYGGTEYSPYFEIIVPVQPQANTTTTGMAMSTTMMSSTTTSLIAYPKTTSTMTATYPYWDQQCGCHKTATVAQMPSSWMTTTGTGAIASPTTWWDRECGCHKTAMPPAPVVTVTVGACGMTANNGTMGGSCPKNYTLPSPTPISQAPVLPSTGTAAPAPRYTGSAVRTIASAMNIVTMGVIILLAM